MKPRIVIDTNIIISALKSRNGASNRMLSLIGEGKYTACISVPLVLEYEEVVRRTFPKMRTSDINDLLSYICKVGEQQQIYYLWRPILTDPDDDMVLEVAVASSADYIVTYNMRDFAAAKKFNVKLASPQEILKEIGEKR